MVNNSLNEFSSFVNQQILSVEDLNEHLAKASALMEVALRYDFSDFPEDTIHNYLWVLSDIIHSAHNRSISALKEVFETNKVVNNTIACYHPTQEVKNGN